MSETVTDAKTTPLGKALGRIVAGEAQTLDLTPAAAQELLFYLEAVDEVIDWYRDNEAVPSLDVRLKILWRRATRLNKTTV